MNVDLFAGKAEIAKAFKRRGMRSIALDIERSPGDATCKHIESCCPCPCSSSVATHAASFAS